MVFEENGPLLAGRYRPLTPLGSGGMGVVWLADDTLLHRRVAIKHLRLEHSGEELETRRKRAMREARVLSVLDHPGIVRIHDMFTDGDHPCIVMAYVEGDTLQDLIDSGRAPGERELVSIALLVAGALDAAHREKVLHRDVKPANIMISDAGAVYLVDFGIAHIIGASQLTSRNTFIGTLEYLAPERLENRTPGPAADLWSLGVTLFAALEGRSPFRRDDNGPATMLAILNDDPPPPSCPGPLPELISRLLRKDPARRLDATGLITALTSLTEKTQKHPVRPPETPVTERATAGTRVDLTAMPPADAASALAAMPSRDAAASLLALAPAEAAPILAAIPAKGAGAVLDAMAGRPEPAAALIGMLSPRRAGRGLSYTPAAQAGVLLAALPFDEASTIFRHIDRRAAAEIVGLLATAPLGGRLIASMPVRDACDVLRYVAPATVAGFLSAAPGGRSEKLLDGLSGPVRMQVVRYLDRP